MKDGRQAKFEAVNQNTHEFNRNKQSENIAQNDQAPKHYSNIWGSTTQSSQVLKLPVNSNAAYLSEMTAVERS